MNIKETSFAFVAGALLGCAVGLLFAPKKGEELRRDIKIKSDDVYDKVVSYDYSEQKDKLVEKLEKVKEKADETLDSAKHLLKKEEQA